MAKKNYVVEVFGIFERDYEEFGVQSVFKDTVEASSPDKAAKKAVERIEDTPSVNELTDVVVVPETYYHEYSFSEIRNNYCS